MYKENYSVLALGRGYTIWNLNLSTYIVYVGPTLYIACNYRSIYGRRARLYRRRLEKIKLYLYTVIS